jgi:hypothetical protein
MIFSRYNIAFTALLILDFILLLFTADSFSISYKEAVIYFNETSLLSKLVHISISAFGQTDIGLRLPFILFYIGSVVLLYLITTDYFKQQIDRFVSILIFMALPGINSAALLVNESIIVIFFILLYLYLFKITNKEHYWLLLVCLFVDNSFAVMYLALFFYSLQKKDNILLVVSLVLFGASMQIYGFESGGWPRGYFLDTFGAYASIFSPAIFFFFFYTMYKIFIKGEKDLYWYISFTALTFSLLFSLRQKIDIEDFAPFVITATPLMVKFFMHSYRVRLPQFRKKHYIFASFVLSTLIINFIVFMVNKPIYLVLKDSNRHFANDYHIAKELAQELKKQNINYIFCKDSSLQKRLKFYGIKKGNTYTLSTFSTNITNKYIDIKYYNKTIKRFYLDYTPN